MRESISIREHVGSQHANVQLEGRGRFRLPKEATQDGIVDEDVRVRHLDEGPEGIIDQVQPRACGEEVVDQEGVAKSAALEHGGVHGLEVLEGAACLKQGGECWECLEGGGGEEEGDDGLPRLDDHLIYLLVVTWLTDNDCSNDGYLFIYLFIGRMLHSTIPNSISTQ